MAFYGTGVRGPNEVHSFHTSATATGNGTAMDVRGLGAVTIQIVLDAGSTFTAKPQGTVDGTNYHDLPLRNKKTGAVTHTAGTVAAAGIYEVDVAGLQYLRLNIASISSTTLTAKGCAALSQTAGEPGVKPVYFSQKISEGTTKTPLTASTGRRLYALWAYVDGTGTTDVDIYHGDASNDTAIANYYSTTKPTGVVNLLPDAIGTHGQDISSGLFIWAKNNDNSSVFVRGLYA